ncbi:MAG: hypothetical protein ACRET2_11750, partial [Steroidobacteraceae bacterium]
MTRLLEPRAPSPAQRRVRWQQLHGSAVALALAESVSLDRRLYLLVTSGARELERLAAEVRFFGGPQVETLTLPDWEILPYELSSPHPDIVSQRLATLHRLPRARGGCLNGTA